MTMHEDTLSPAPAPVPAQPVRNLEQHLTKLLYVDGEKLAYIILLVLAVLTRFWDLGDRVMSHDESLHTKFSWYLYTGEGFAHTPLMHGPLLFHMVALCYQLFGDNDFTARIYPALVGIVVVMIPFLMRKWLGKFGALAASVMFLISPMILYYSRYIRHDLPAILAALVMALVIWRYVEKRENKYLIWLSAAMVVLYASKEVSFIYIAIFGSFLTIYFVLRLLDARWEDRAWFAIFGVALIATLLGVIALGSVFYARGLMPEPPLETDLTSPPPAVEPVESLIEPGIPGWAMFLAQDLVLYIVGGISGLAIAALFLSVLIGQWRNLRKFPELDVMMVMGTLILPMLTPFLIAAAGFDPVDESAEGVMRSMWFTLPMLFASIIIGGLWGIRPPKSRLVPDRFALPEEDDEEDPMVEVPPDFLDWVQAFGKSRWWAIGGLFWLVFLLFFTTMFTNGDGVGTGIIGSLGYWLAQQEVERGGQPWYYYLVVQVPIYEFLPALLTIAAGIFGVVMGIRNRLNRPDQPPASADESDAAVQPRAYLDLDAPVNFPVMAFLGYWVVMNFIAYSVAGEKMPWLTTHLTTPMILLGGWLVGLLIETIEWSKLRKNNAWVLLLLIPVLAVAFLRATAPLCTVIRPPEAKTYMSVDPMTGVETETIPPLTVGETLVRLIRLPCNSIIPVDYQQGLKNDDTITELSANGAWLLAIVVLIGVIVGIVVFGRDLGLGQFVGLSTLFVIGWLIFLTARTAWLAAFVNYDDATEFLVYAHSAGAVKDVLDQIEEISLKTTDGYGLRVAYDNRVSWPFSWYFRDYYNAIFYGEQPSRGLIGDAPVVLAGPDNWVKVEPLLGDRYYQFEYIRMWWPMQDYFGLDGEDFVNFLRDDALQRGIWDIFYRRDYVTYGEAVGREFEISQWPVAERMRLYIRKDVFAQVWDYGVAASEIAEAIDPYAEGMRDLSPDLIFGANAGLDRPHGMTLGPDGLLYVADTNNHRIAIFDLEGNFLRAFGVQGYAPAPGVLNEPWDVAVDSEGMIYVADTWNHRVVVLDQGGNPVAGWGYEGPGLLSDPMALWGPRGIAVDSDGQVYVSDTGNKRIQVYDSEGNFLRQIGSGGGLDGQLDEPSGLVISADDTLYVADTWNQRVEVFDTQGLYLRNWFIDAWFAQTNERPYLDVGANGNVYVTDPEGFRVIVFDSQGNYLYSFGDFATVGQAASVVTDNQGHLFVVNTEAGNIQRYNLNGIEDTSPQ